MQRNPNKKLLVEVEAIETRNLEGTV